MKIGPKTSNRIGRVNTNAILLTMNKSSSQSTKYSEKWLTTMHLPVPKSSWKRHQTNQASSCILSPTFCSLKNIRPVISSPIRQLLSTIWARTSLGQSHRLISSRIWKNSTQLRISMSIAIKNTMTRFHLDRPKFLTSPSGFKIAKHNPCQSLATKPTLATIQGDISPQIKPKLKSRLNAKTSFSSTLRTWAMSEDEAIHVWI